MVVSSPGRGVSLKTLDLARLLRTEWGYEYNKTNNLVVFVGCLVSLIDKGVRVLSQGRESSVITPPGEPISNPGGADEKRLPEVDFRVSSCQLKIFSRLKTFFNITGPGPVEGPGTKQFGSQPV
jgi:hypothetical protein